MYFKLYPATSFYIISEKKSKYNPTCINDIISS